VGEDTQNGNRDVQILIVDDEEDFLEPISYWLSKQGYTVTTARSGDEMIKLLSRNKYDIMFLDINMQPMDGFECLKKSKEMMPGLPVLMLSVQYNEMRDLKAKQLGADGFYYKGLAYKHVTGAIQEILKKKRSSPEA